ncbi:MAG TPA: Ig-like domain-containing protein, partial [Chitinophagaceae bacterium]|nr:Ig-like domain-containing protein [Chitinophagaceae bacterium]
MTLIATTLLTLLTLTTSAGCHKMQNDGYELTGINLNVASLDLKTGERFQLRATAVPALANQPNYEWTSTDLSVATVINGLVTAVSPGKTNISVTYRNIRREIAVDVSPDKKDDNHVVLYEKQLTGSSFPDLVLNGVGQPEATGLLISGKNDVVRLNRFYALAERKVQYEVVFSEDALAIFRSSEGDFSAFVDVKNKSISIATNPVTKKEVSFLTSGRAYLIEIYHIYQLARLRITDIRSGAAAET